MSVLNYKRVNDSLVLIDGDTLTIYVPLKLKAAYFKELLSVLDELNICHEEFVDGEDVWKNFEELMTNHENDFIRYKAKMQKLHGLMSYFSFSVYPEGKDFNVLQTYGEERFGYFYLASYRDIYSLESGINTTFFTESMFV